MAPARTTSRQLQYAPPATAWKRSLGRRLTAWFARARRDLPWRRGADAYRVWVSEIMLQQTQVATVVPYFERFVAAFPGVAALAAADEHEVLRHWEGLGYYRRARQMHRAARVIVERHGGRFPRELDSVRELPGVGRYTAGAIVSIAYDLRAPILEANTVRLLSRLVAFRGDVVSSAGREVLWQVAEAILPARRCGLFNQALMELGSLVCTPRAPRCDDCPLAALCAARQRGLQNEIPRMRPKPPGEAVREAAVLVRRGRAVLLRRRAAGERWAGLWDFLRFPLADHHERPAIAQIVERVRGDCGLKIGRPEHIATLKHGVTRFRITLDCYAAKARGRLASAARRTWHWVPIDELGKYALSTTGRKLARLLQDA